MLLLENKSVGRVHRLPDVKLKTMDATAYRTRAFGCLARFGTPLAFSAVKAHPSNSLYFTKSPNQRLRISGKPKTPLKHVMRVPRFSCSVVDDSGVYSESAESSASVDSPKDATIDIKLPRRSLLVTFTCNACGARSKKLVNRLAYEKGTIYVECAGCFKYHSLVDNLGLVVEYDFREEVNEDSSTDQA